MNCVVYARYSSDNQREESIQGQLRECQAYAEQRGLTVLNTYVDRAKTGKNDNRPAFQQMIADARKNLFDVILVWKLDRFSRDKYDSAHYKYLLKNNNVRVISATEPIDETPEGQLMESIFEGFAAYYVAELAVKINRGLTENALKCKFNGGTIPFGYVIDAHQYFQIDPVSAPIVREVYVDYADGKTIKAIVDGLNEKGIRTSRGSMMTINIVTRMLKNRRYIGEYKYKDVLVENAFDLIVSKDLFDLVQEKMQINKKAPARKKEIDESFILTTKLICGKCGAFMAGESGTGKSGKKHYYYKCSHAKNKKTCDKKAVKKDWIENLVFGAAMDMLKDQALIDKLVDAILATQGKESSELPLLQRQLAEVEKSANNILNAIQQGILNEFTKTRLDELTERKEQLEVAILQEKIAKPQVSKEQILFWLDGFKKLDTSDYGNRKRIIDIFVNAVYVYDNEVKITFNYKDGVRHLDLREFEGSSLESLGAGKSPYLNPHCVKCGFKRLLCWFAACAGLYT